MMKYLPFIIAFLILLAIMPAKADHVPTINVNVEEHDLVIVCDGTDSSDKVIALKDDIETMGYLHTITVGEAAENRGCSFGRFTFTPKQILCVFSRHNTLVFTIASAMIGDGSVDYIIVNQRTNAIYPACTDEILGRK